MTDEELVKELQQREALDASLEDKLERRSLVEEILGRHYDWVLGLCLAEIADADLAADCAQEIMMQIAKGLNSFRGDSKLSTWIFTISKRQIGKSRKRHQTLRSRFLLSKPIEAVSDSPRVDERMIKAEGAEKLLQAVRKLPEKQRYALEFHYFEDLSVRETAERLGCSEATVKTHLHRGRKKLEEFLDND